MSIKYVDDIDMDLGEKIHISGEVRPVCDKDIPFEVRSARWELHREDPDSGQTSLEAEGECTINGHILDALIHPEQAARYRFKFIYEVADETWIDVYKLRVN